MKEKKRKTEEQIQEIISQIDWYCSQVPSSINREGIEIRFDRDQYVKNAEQMLRFCTEEFTMKTGIDMGGCKSDFILMACTIGSILKSEDSYSHIFDTISNLSEPQNLILFRGKFSKFYTGSRAFRVELKLCPAVVKPILDPSAVFSDDFIYEETIGEISNTWHIVIGWYEQKKEDDPIFNRNGGFRHAVSKRIPMLQWKPGHLYLDSLGKTRLYLGVRKIYILSDRKEGEVEWAKEQYCDSEETVKQSCGMICSIPYTNVESFISECKTISDVFQKLFEKAEYKESLYKTVSHPVTVGFFKDLGMCVGDDQADLALPYKRECVYYLYDDESKADSRKKPIQKIEEFSFVAHIDTHQKLEHVAIKQIGRSYILLDMPRFESSVFDMRSEYDGCDVVVEYSGYKRWGVKINAYKKQLKKLYQKAYDLMNSDDFLEKIPLSKDGYVKSPRKILVEPSILESKMRINTGNVMRNNVRIGLFLEPYSEQELLERFSGTEIPLIPDTIVSFKVDFGSKKAIPIV